VHLGRDWLRCNCALWVEGTVEDTYIRRSLKTRNMKKAQAAVQEIEEGLRPSEKTSVKAAVDAWLDSLDGQTKPTKEKYRRVANTFVKFMGTRVRDIGAVTISHIDGFRLLHAHKSPLTRRKEMEILRAIFSFSIERDWVRRSPIKKSHMPKEPRPEPRRPYSPEEIAAILDACKHVGKSEKPRTREKMQARAKAMVLLMRYYGLRISDVAKFRKDEIRGGQLWIRAKKNQENLWLPLYDDVKAALDALPPVQHAPQDNPYYFWTGVSDLRTVVKTLWRSLRDVFTLSGVQNAHPHRFRHTLVTEILIAGGSIEDAANIIGDSPQIVRKHYKRWSQEYQNRTVSVLNAVHAGVENRTNLAQIENVEHKSFVSHG
jgi:integrase